MAPLVAGTRLAARLRALEGLRGGGGGGGGGVLRLQPGYAPQPLPVFGLTLPPAPSSAPAAPAAAGGDGAPEIEAGLKRLQLQPPPG
jgi:hypothetical protein